MSFNTTPTFNLKAVIKETGIAADTLRAWERRYGLPMPDRTSGGHRLYSQRDIEIIKWLISKQKEGLSISRAVDMWNELTASGQEPLPAPVSLSAIPSIPTANLDLVRQQWLDACMKFNETAAEQVLNQAFALHPLETVCVEVLQRGLREVGERWYNGEITVQQEHFTSALTHRRMNALIAATPPPTRPETILVGCPADEWHTFTPLLLSLLLRRRGYKVIYLGANVPTDRFTETAKDTEADLVLLVAQQLVSAATLQSAANTLANEDIPVAFGGRIFNLRPSLTDYIPGYFLGNEIGASIGELEKVLKSKSLPRAAKVASQAHTVAHQSFISKRSMIEATLKEMLAPLSISPADIDTGIHFLGDHITAALQLDDMSHVSAEIDWLRVLLVSHATNPGQLVNFIETYARAVDKHINGSGRPIFEWLSSEGNKLQHQEKI